MDRGYPPEALRPVQDGAAWELVPGYDPARRGLRLETAAAAAEAEADAVWEWALGPSGRGDPQGPDARAPSPDPRAPDAARLFDARGALLAEGLAIAGPPLFLHGPGGGMIRVDRIAVDGRAEVLLASEPLEPGQVYPAARQEAQPVLALEAADLAALPALGAGTMIATDEGEQPVDWLRPGDRVLTRDNGYRPIQWIAQLSCRADAERIGAHRLALEARIFGADQPQRELVVSAGLRLLLGAPELQLWFGEAEMFARADQMLAAARPVQAQRTTQVETHAGVPPAREERFFVMALPRHEVILAEGLWVETLQAHPEVLAHLPPDQAGALAAQLGAAHALSARAELADWELRMFTIEAARRAQLVAA
ncbi:Hint domain-containing protein [Phaeovulum vinaykumarii]|uniref:Hint domain-containing protein n=1 Tax=Phaeovulum vinaykumarii TaxID=407234 RepID=A0A1N7K9Z4_9RHOB|nr:Hint domain-containing protein [Phaeovulum vinaykumarii]SIS58284.1 Hint domain-containing protein [Phaeovulum vinaykumarii]SOB93741.1 Hint domain-containing protein [Phaeovulum vinaykumarii]